MAAAATKFELAKNWRDLLKAVAKERKIVSVSNEETEAALDWLRKSRASYAQVIRPAELGDSVEVDFETKNEGEIIEGGTAANHRLVLGEGNSLPGFEEKIVGMKAGEEKDFFLEAPSNYWVSQIAGKKLYFRLKLKSVQSREMPEANDEFAKSVSRFQTIAELRSSIGEFLKMEKEEKERQRFRLLLLEQIDSQSTIELGPEAIEAEIQTMMQELKASVSTMGLRWEQYLAQIKETEGSLRLKIKGEAERRLRYALLLHAIAKAENIEPSREEVTKEANKFLRQFSSPREAESQIDMTTLLDYSKNALRNEKVFQLLETYAT